MSSSARKGSSNRDAVGDNETIFDFLKRKKQFNLENTVHSHSSTKRKNYDLEDQFPQTRDLTKYRTFDSQKHGSTARQTITPKKIEFEDSIPASQPEKKQAHAAPTGNHRRGKSFLAMISPIKQRSSSVLEERKDPNENENRQKSGVKGGRSEGFTRGKVTKCINSLKQTVNHLNGNLSKIKEKAHGLTVLFNPILSKTDSAGDLRNKLKAFESLIEGVTLQNCDQMMQGFHRTLEDHIQSELHHMKKDIEKDKQEQISSIKEDKQAKIDQLTAQLKKIHKQNELLCRRLELAEKNMGKVESTVSEREETHLQQMDRHRQSYQSAIDELTAKNAELQQQLRSAQTQARQAQKNYKNQRMLKESSENRYREQLQQITEAKDAYLLNEIMVLKAQFNADITRVNELHRLKEAELLDRLNGKEEQLKKKVFEKGCDKQIESKILEEANLIKQENLQLKTKSECIITDMYRMNQELYQHWMALKDVKLLATRLGSFPQFRKIYDDLLFNDHLFH